MNTSELCDEGKRQDGARQLSGTAATLRRQFDASFAAPVAAAAARFEAVLAVRLGGDPYALRLSEIAGLYADCKVVPVPSSFAALMGIVGLRGVMAPVYDLAALLGYPPVANARWMVLARASAAAGSAAVGFAFEIFEAHMRVPQSSFASGEDQRAARPHVLGAVQTAGALRPLLHVASVLETIRSSHS